MSAPSRRRCCRSPTRPASSNSRGASRRSASRSCRPAAPRRRWPTPGSGHRDRRLHRISGNARRPRQDAASRRCTPASSRGATCRRTPRRSREHGIPPIDLVVVNLYPFRETVAKPGLHARRGDREHRHRRSDAGARRGEELAARRRRRRSGGLRRACSPSSRPTATRFRRRRASRSRARRSRTRRPTTAPSRTGSPRAARRRGRAFPDRVQSAGREGAGPALRRESASAGGVLSRRAAGAGHASPRTGSCRARSCRSTTSPTRDAAWECVKTLRRPRRRVRDRQARESLRRRDRGDAARGLPQGVRDRSGVGVRRHHRVRPAGRRRDARGRSAQFLEVLIAPGYTADALAVIAQEEERARAGGRAAGASAPPPQLRLEAHRRRLSACRAPTTRNVDARRSFSVVTAKAPTEAQMRRPAVRLARRQVREDQRDRLLRRRRARSASAPGR